MAKVVGVVVGAAMVAYGAATGNLFMVFQGATMVGGALMTPKIKKQARQAAETTIQVGEVPRAAIFGEAATGGSLVDAFNYGGKYGTDWEVLILALADHRCEALSGFYVNDKYVPFTGNGAVAGYKGQLVVHFLPGTEVQALPSILTTNGWPAGDNMAGVSGVVVAYLSDKQDAKEPIWTGGRPRFLWVVKGKRCYIARRDGSVAGGSGTHRWNDPATWEWTDNPIDCRYNWARGVYACDRIGDPSMLLVGRGLTAVEAPPQFTFAPANVCDELVTLAGGGSEKRYRASGVIRADETYLDVEEKFAAACAGVITEREGSVEIEPGHAKSPVAFITDADLIVGTNVAYSDFRSEADGEWINTVAPRYIEPAQQWADHAAPIRRDVADLIADGGPREEPLSLEFVTSGTQAQRCGEVRRRMGRLQKTGSNTLGPRFAGIEEGDWIVWTSARRTKGLPVTFRVESYGLSERWQNGLQLREIDASVYGWNAGMAANDGAVAVATTPPPAIGAPGAAWTVAGTTLSAAGASIPALVVTGQADDDQAEAVLIEYRLAIAGQAAGAGWTGAGVESPTLTRKEISSVAAAASYEVAISYRVQGTPGDRLVLGPVTTGALTAESSGSVGGIDEATLQASIDATTAATTALVTANDAIVTLRDRVTALEAQP